MGDYITDRFEVWVVSVPILVGKAVTEAIVVAAINKPEHWRSRAAEALAIAERMTSPETKAIMLSIVAGY